jgi:hypothetical protein
LCLIGVNVSHVVMCVIKHVGIGVMLGILVGVRLSISSLCIVIYVMIR